MDDLKFTQFDEHCLNLVSESGTSCRGRHCLRNAINHLKKGWRLRKIDPEMAVFRGLTAEEEAASGLFYTLKFRNYNNARLLNPRNHQHKNSIVPFLHALSYFFGEFLKSMKISPTLQIKDDGGGERLRVAISMKIDGQDVFAYPEPPLNFNVTLGGKKPNFKPQMERFLESQSQLDILEHLKDEANLRNRVLYASDEGYPLLEDLKDSFFYLRKRNVMTMIMAYLLIEPWAENQPFVQQSLDALLVMLKKLEVEDFSC